MQWRGRQHHRGLVVGLLVAGVVAVVVVVITLAVVLTRPSEPPPSGTVTVVVNVSDVATGTAVQQQVTYATAFGFNRAPLCPSGGSFVDEMHAMGTTLVRTHDLRVLDWWVIFPDPSADPENPANYNFTAGDAFFAVLAAANQAAYFRLGTSWPPGPPAVPAWSLCPNATLFARVALHTVQHYNRAEWAGGFTGDTVRYWEIWNEPDGTDPVMWCGTAQEFYTLFNLTVNTLKAYDPTLLVGGPGVAHAGSQEYSYGLLDFVVAANTPIDFFSWHAYGSQAKAPQSVVQPAVVGVRAYLDRIGLAHVAQHTTEWYSAIVPSQAVANSPLSAAFVATVFTILAQGNASVSLLYPACEGVGPYSWGLFQDPGDGTVVLRPETYAYRAVGQTLRDTPWRLAATFDAAEDFSVLAGASSAGVQPANVSVVLSAQQLRTAAAQVTVAGLAPGATATIIVQLIDATHTYATVYNATSTVSGQGTVNVTHPFATPAVARVQVFVQPVVYGRRLGAPRA